MPKLLVLFQSRQPDVVELAEAAMEGARRVRFAEADLRRLPSADEGTTASQTDASGRRQHRALEHVDGLTAYDGLILVASTASEASAALAQTVGALGTALADKVGSALTPVAGADRSEVLWAALTPMANSGMILVPAPFDDASDQVEAARRLGTRIAEVIGWVTHARSHHHGHAGHAHSHEHRH